MFQESFLIHDLWFVNCPSSTMQKDSCSLSTLPSKVEDFVPSKVEDFVKIWRQSTLEFTPFANVVPLVKLLENGDIF